MTFNTFLRHTWALTKKNLIVAVRRKWFSTLLRAYIVPILFISLLLEIPNFAATTSNKYGIGSPHGIPSLADSMSDSKRLVIVDTPGLGPDFQPLVDKIVAPLDGSLILRLSNQSDITSSCNVDYNGNTPCHAAVIFNDSPLSGRVNATWNYTILGDPSHNGGVFDVFAANNDYETRYLPLQVAIENAMTNSTVSPQVMSYTARTQDQMTAQRKEEYQSLAIYLLSFVFFFSMAFVVHHATSMLASDRDYGHSQLMDAMGGGLEWARIMSYVITFDLLYLPTWIILGVLFWNLLLSTSSAAISIFWQILTGWAVTSASIFGATFFKRHAFAAIMVTIIMIILSVVAAFLQNVGNPPTQEGTVLGLSILFPSMIYVFFFSYVGTAELQGLAVDLNKPLPYQSSNQAYYTPRPSWVNTTQPFILFIFLAIHIVVFALLAVLVEKLRHGNGHSRRTFANSTEDQDSNVSIETTGLVKTYKSSGKKKSEKIFKAVDDLNLASQKRQILCLLGPNGSGKTTTLDMIAGFTKPTAGAIRVHAASSQLGICPQKNVLWDNLTVYEHLVLWNELKGNVDDAASIERLVEICDLSQKRSTIAKHLSGGMKRKLQLACMFVGGSLVCLMDEVTSGLDPISRRVIWNAILAERARRSMIFTTHFLDECEVLSDHIAILSLGKLKCQGTPAELKNEFGGGYRVHIAKTTHSRDVASGFDYPITEERDRYVITTPDSTSASQVITHLPGSDRSLKAQDVYLTGPTIEDVFLKVSEQPPDLKEEMAGEVETEMEDLRTSTLSSGSITTAHQTPDTQPIKEASAAGKIESLSPTKVFFRQVWALFLKRIFILRSQWWVYILALGIPIIATSQIGPFLKDYQTPDCTRLVSRSPFSSDVLNNISPSTLLIDPPSFNTTIVRSMAPPRLRYTASFRRYSTYAGYSSKDAVYGPFTTNDHDSFLQFIQQNSVNASSGISMPDNTSSPLLAVRLDSSPVYNALALQNLASEARSGISIIASYGTFSSYYAASYGNSIFWIVIFCLLQVVYPACFALYPTFERGSQVRALQYSNGIRPAPLWLAYTLFDFCIVLLIAIVNTALISRQGPFWGLGYIFFILVLHGVAATLLSYLISLTMRSQPAVFVVALFIMLIEFAISEAVSVTTGSSSNLMAQDGVTFGLGIIFPIQNLIRAMTVSLNGNIVRCRGSSMVTYQGSIYAYGGPILLLILQIIGFGLLLIWLEGFKFPWSAQSAPQNDEEAKNGSGRTDVDAETHRVENSTSDLLRTVHLSKNFGSFTAVDDVSLGLQPGEILALLGPNGAGKTTMVNMIRGDLTPSRGHIYVEGADVIKHTLVAKQRLGVCPQFDALDMLTVREQLSFYARCKGVPDVKADVAHVLAKVGITAHAGKRAKKLSGGQKRKLSLAIALLGSPPVLILDEPSSAMDAASKRVLWKTLQAVAPGRSVLITTHSMEEADALATRAAIISKRVLAVGTTQQLRMAHSNEYHVHIILKTAPVSTVDEMQRVADWATTTFPNVQFEGENLGGQVRFIVPADSAVPKEARVQGKSTSFVSYMIEMLEKNKHEFGVDCYSIGAATMERVFLSVVKESDVDEEEDHQKRKWLRF